MNKEMSIEIEELEFEESSEEFILIDAACRVVARGTPRRVAMAEAMEAFRMNSAAEGDPSDTMALHPDARYCPLPTDLSARAQVYAIAEELRGLMPY